MFTNQTSNNIKGDRIMLYTSTRDNSVRVSSAVAIAKGISDDGGLFVPTEIPKLTGATLELYPLGSNAKVGLLCQSIKGFPCMYVT